MTKIFSYCLVIVAALGLVVVSGIPFVPREIDSDSLFEGDIAGIENSWKGAAQIPTQTRLKWKWGIIPYEISSDFNEAHRTRIQSAMKMVEDLTRGPKTGRDCIKFVPHTVEKTFTRVINGSGCWSFVGRQAKEGVQEVSLKIPGCLTNAIVAHEFIHALGFFHEQSRPDRGDWVDVQWENIDEDKQHNFNLYNDTVIDFLGLPYDVASVMHYSGTSFSNNGKPTMIAKDPSIQGLMGQRKTLSKIDIEELRLFYNCEE